jgi:hypothetical protein
MPALPWVKRQPIVPDREYVVMASRLPLKAYRYVPGFLRDTMRIRRQIATTDGLVGYALNAELTRKDVLDVLGLDRPVEPRPFRRHRPAPTDHPATPAPHERDEVRVLQRHRLAGP